MITIFNLLLCEGLQANKLLDYCLYLSHMPAHGTQQTVVNSRIRFLSASVLIALYLRARGDKGVLPWHFSFIF